MGKRKGRSNDQQVTEEELKAVLPSESDDEDYELAEIVEDDSADESGPGSEEESDNEADIVNGIDSDLEGVDSDDAEDAFDSDELLEAELGDEASSDESPEEELLSSDAEDDDDEGKDNGVVRVLRPAKPLPEIEAEYDEDTSDEETTNTIGNVPLEWYKDMPHIGYTKDGKRILKSEKGDQLDQFLSAMDDPDAWRSVYNKLEDKNIVLTKEELEMVKRIQEGQFPDPGFDPYEPTVEWFTSKTEIMPLNAAPEPKRRFIPSKHEAHRIMHIVRAIRAGRIVPKDKQPKKPDERHRFFDIWKDVPDTATEDRIMHIAAPKMALPEHDESYNPPSEYVPTKEEIAEWEGMDAEDRPKNFITKKYNSLRQVPGYGRFIQERFDRCLDLYLCPRMVKKKLNIDPESLIPKLPNPRDLQPFPTALAITFKGHTGRVRSISVDPTGQWLASCSDDSTVKLWEITSGRCVQTWTLDEPVTNVAWNPNKSIWLLAAVAQTRVFLITPEFASAELAAATDVLINALWLKDDQTKLCEWSKPADADIARGIRVQLKFDRNVTYLTWHRKGDYFATVSPDGASKSVLIHQLSKRSSQNPFRKAKGLVQRVLFHPSKPFFFVATQRYVRVYNLMKQELSKRLQSGAKWISSMDIHPGGDNVIVGTYDKRLCWFDMDLSTKPYKTLRYHKFALRNVSYHRRYPLFASCSDDGSVNIFHGMVYNDLMQNPLIVPVKTLRAHDVINNLGVLHCEFHPTQPWIFSCGADTTIKLFS
ncbi:Ribosome biogenesis protein 1 [Gaertneriomyces sp. JEL0708]|nr:Ribosome biogenesis protein 1 [Gaertneriomyces sp. JEL0708]